MIITDSDFWIEITMKCYFYHTLAYVMQIWFTIHATGMKNDVLHLDYELSNISKLV